MIRSEDLVIKSDDTFHCQSVIQLTVSLIVSRVDSGKAVIELEKKMKCLPVTYVLIVVFGIACCKNLQDSWSEVSLNDEDVQRVVDFASRGSGYCREAFEILGVLKKVSDAQLSYLS